jgi:hypothetical protein
VSSTPQVDLSKIRRSHWFAGVGAIVLIVSTFLNWFSVSYSVGPGLSVSAGISGNDALDVIPWIVWLSALGVLALIGIELFRPDVDVSDYAGMATAVAGGICALLILYRIVFTPGPSISTAIGHLSVDPAFGIFVALLASVAIAYGGYLRLQES